MKVRKNLIFCCVVSLLVARLFLGTQQEKQEQADWLQPEEFLRKAQVTSVAVNENAGRTAPWDVILDDGKTQKKARFKNIDRSRPDILPDSYHYEVAAYELSKFLDLPIIPPVVEREIRGEKGALQLFLEGCIPLDRQKRTEKVLLVPQRLEDALDEIIVFENVTYCMHEESDILIHEEDGRVCRVDFSEAFAPEESLIPGVDIDRCSTRLYRKLTSVNPEDLRFRLKPHLNAQELGALLVRIDLILQRLKERIREKGEKEVLFEF